MRTPVGAVTTVDALLEMQAAGAQDSMSIPR